MDLVGNSTDPHYVDNMHLSILEYVEVSNNTHQAAGVFEAFLKCFGLVAAVDVMRTFFPLLYTVLWTPIFILWPSTWSDVDKLAWSFSGRVPVDSGSHF